MLKSKVLLFLFMFSLSSLILNANNSNNNYTNNETYFSDLTVELTFEDGQTSTFCIDSLEEFESLDSAKGVLVCTITHGGTGCSCSGPTCASARACFRQGCMSQIERDNT